MADSDLTKCLLDAVKVLRKVDDLDPEEQENILARLVAIAKKERDNPRDRVVAVEQSIRNARQNIIGAAVAQKRHEEVLGRLTEDPRFRVDTLEDAETAAENFKRWNSPALGNVGDATDSTLVSKMRFEFRSLGAKFNRILDFITDSRYGAKDSESARLFYMEMVGMDSGSATARDLAKDFRDAVAPYLTRLRKAGVMVDVIKDYFPQAHDMPKIRRDMKGWREFMRENLDPEQHPDPQATTDALWETLTRREVVEPTGAGVNMQRKIRFSSPEAELEYYYRFGNGAVAKDMTALVHKLSHATVLAEQYGPRSLAAAEQVRQNISQAAHKLDTDGRRAQALDRRMDVGIDVVRFLSQPPTLPKYQRIENWASGIRLGFGALKLGMVTMQQVVEDPTLGVLFGRAASGGYWNSFTSRATRLAELLDAKGELRKFVEAWGLWQNTHLMMTAARTQTASDAVGMAGNRVSGEAFREGAARGLGITQRWTGQFWLENWQRSASFMVMHDGVARHTSRTWNDLSGSDFRSKLLERNGITKQDWDVIRKTPTGQFGILDLGELEKRAPATFRKYMAMAVNEAEVQTNFPDVESLLWAQGIKTGHYTPQARKFITQFWGWGLSIQRRGVAREFQSGIMPGTVAFGSTLAVSAAGLQLYALAGGDPPYRADSKDLWLRALGRSAAVGPVVPTIVDTVAGGAFASVPGAVPSTLQRVGSGVARGGMDALTGDLEATGVEGLKITKTLLPNWWMTDAALSKSVDAMIFELDPQELRKRNRRWAKEERMGE